MRPVDRSEVLPIGEYETIRDRFRARVIDEKKRRRLRVADRASVIFENHDTALFQIQEMLRTERITREGAILHEIETYNELVPNDNEVSATVMIEIDDKAEREAFLMRAKGLEDQVSIVIDGERYAGKTTPERRLDDRASAVIYLKFALSPHAVSALRDKTKEHAVELRFDHEAFTASAPVPRAVVLSLAEDFEG
jgi:hypothetical protein